MSHTPESLPTSEPLHIPLSLLKQSPRSVVTLALDWLDASKDSRDQFKSSSDYFMAARQLFHNATELFLHDEKQHWGESPKPAFWTLFFKARAQGAPVSDLISTLNRVDRKLLTPCAKDLMILAARSGDTASFNELLDLGVARRSKLVLFSAYQHGGKKVAMMVKKPTKLEAQEMIDLGCSTGPRGMHHHTEDFSWLMDLTDQPLNSKKLLNITVQSEDPNFFEDIFEQYESRIEFKTENVYHHLAQTSIPINSSDPVNSMILSLASIGKPQAAKKLAIKKGGHALWSKVCHEGFCGFFNLPVKDKSYYRGILDLPIGVRNSPIKTAQGSWIIPVHPNDSKTTLQAACILSLSSEACQWLRAEYEALKAPWLSSQHLMPLFTLTQQQIKSSLFDNAISLSESTDFQFIFPQNTVSTPPFSNKPSHQKTL